MQNAGEVEARRDLAAAHRLAVRNGLNEGTWNHLSVMSPDDPEVMLITPGFTHWSQVTASNLAAVGSDGEPVAGQSRPTRAGWIIHYPVHRAVPDAKCLMHVHSPYITALSMKQGVRLDTCSSQQAAQFHGDVAYYEVYDGLLNDEDEGRRMAETMDGKRVLMMRNHGAMVAGGTVASAYVDLYQLERACMYQLLAMNGGGAMVHIPEDIAQAMSARAREGHSDPHFGAMRRLLDAKEPDYAD